MAWKQPFTQFEIPEKYSKRFAHATLIDLGLYSY